MVALPPATEPNGIRVTGADTLRQEQPTAPPSRFSYYDSQTNTVFTVSSFDVSGPTLRDEQKFRSLADQWRKDTRYVSSLSKITMHPAYQKIIGMGCASLPLILRELQQKGGHWLWALHAITDEDPAPENATFHEAVLAWLVWGKRQGHLR